MKLLVLAALAACLPASGALAQAKEEVLNEPSANWSVYGTGQTHKGRRDKEVQGGGAMRVTIAAKPANPWDAGASSPISKPIKKGDKLILAIWVRLISGGADGKTSIAAAIQRASAPYDPIVNGQVDLGPAWKLVHIEGTAQADFAAGTANVALSLGTAAHVIDLGPVYVMAVR